MRASDHPLVAVVVRRINDMLMVEGPEHIVFEMPLSAAEFAACHAAVKEHLKARGLPPIPATRTGRGILFKGIEIYVSDYDAHLGAVDA